MEENHQTTLRTNRDYWKEHLPELIHRAGCTVCPCRVECGNDCGKHGCKVIIEEYLNKERQE